MKKYLPFILVLALVLSGCSGQGKTSSKPAETKTATPTGEVKLPTASRPIVVIETDFGNIELELRPDKAPKTCENFLKLVNKGFYDSLIFHRVIPKFMIQCGDPDGTGRGGPGYTVPAEITDLKHSLGAVACARLPDQANPQKASSGSQFYITVVPTPHLDNEYTIFGYAISGMDAVQKIAVVKTGQGNKPVETVYMKKVYEKKPKTPEKK